METAETPALDPAQAEKEKFIEKFKLLRLEVVLRRAACRYVLSTIVYMVLAEELLNVIELTKQ